MSDKFTAEEIEEKNKQRAALRREFLKQFTDPHRGLESGHIFDPALQRWLSMRATEIDYYRHTPKTQAYALIFLILPIAFSIYFVRKDRIKKEAEFRAGKIAYKDRAYKLI